MDFRAWLLNERSIQFTTFMNDGTIVVYIDGKRYEYVTDALYHGRWKKMLRYRPWEVLQQIKKVGQLVEPPQPEPTVEPARTKQLRLF